MKNLHATSVLENRPQSFRAERSSSISHEDLLDFLAPVDEEPGICHMLQPLVEHLLDMLTVEEAAVLRLRYGLDDGYPKTFAEIAKGLRITRAEASTIETNALAKLYRHIMLTDEAAGRN